MTPLLTADRISRTFPGPPPLTVLHPTDVTLHRGESVAVVGASGSGKSTLLSLLGTLDRPTTGTLCVDGRDVATMGERERATLRATRIGFVFQQFHLLPTLSALDNVATGLLYAGVGAVERRERAAAALDAVGLAARRTHRPGQLSGGEQQRVAIARAIARTPDLLFADEPTGALDSVTGEAIVALLAGIAATGTTVVVVTHDAAVADRFARRISLRDGRIVDDHGPGPGDAR
ncbi:ABC transporter ATP-binding protein [Polymorphospora rubra]|uniref:Peptide ABC transporter ATP-binding protein n=1 Tax=Polymorphospora rubra TaxID=338584 RepID=A0A810MV94_9ACTN|nr:ABC transporter ATP-binding protein [Polymorphospora rubra]BCJ64932.1 peptide ABC transporter ATP-binding protein [Polymorphospora rubra]